MFVKLLSKCILTIDCKISPYFIEGDAIMKNVFIHKSAEVSDKATIGEGTKIWNNAQVRENAHIGKNCVIAKDVYIDRNVHIGDSCKIENGVSVYCGVTIEDNVFVGPNATFTNDKYPRAFVPNNCKDPATTIRQGASIGAGAVIVSGITIGRFAMIGAGSLVSKNVEDYALLKGNPTRFAGWVCRCGEKVSEQAECCAKCVHSDFPDLLRKD